MSVVPLIVTSSTHHTLDLIISYGTNPTEIDIIMQSEDVTYHYMVTCTRQFVMLHHVIHQAEQSFQPLYIDFQIAYLIYLSCSVNPNKQMN